MHWNLSKSKILFFKRYVKKMKWQVLEWEKIFANHLSNKSYYLECIKDSQNSTAKNKKKRKNLKILRWAKYEETIHGRGYADAR